MSRNRTAQNKPYFHRAECEICGRIYSHSHLNTHKRLAHKIQIAQLEHAVRGSESIKAILSLYGQLSETGQQMSEMKRGEIWLVRLDPTSGHEQQGRRLVLIVSPEAFNRVAKLPVVVPITTGGSFARTAGFAVPLAGAGTKTTGVVRCDRPRVLDFAARGAKKLEKVRDGIVDEVLAKLMPIFE